MKRTLIRIALIIVLIAFSVLMYQIGRGYYLYIENKPITDATGAELQPIQGAQLFIDGKRATRFAPGEKLITIVGGKKHHFMLRYVSDVGTEKNVERNIVLDTKGGYYYRLSIPMMVNGNSDWLVHFTPEKESTGE